MGHEIDVQFLTVSAIGAHRVGPTRRGRPVNKPFGKRLSGFVGFRDQKLAIPALSPLRKPFECRAGKGDADHVGG